MAKILILLLGVLFLHGKCGLHVFAQTDSTASATTTDAEVTGSGEDVCMSDPCANGGQCTAVGDTDFTCDCTDGWGGETCTEPLQCPERADTVIMDDVQQDYNCDNTTALDETGEMLNVTFASTPVGGTAFSVEVCKNACDSAKNRSIASMKCGEGGQWEDPTPKSCRVVDELANALEDTNPDTATQNDVENAIDVVEQQTSADNIMEQDADETTAIINNMIIVTDTGAQSAVEDNSMRILGSVDSLSDSVELTANGDAATYHQEQSNLGICVVADNSAARAIAGTTVSYGSNGLWVADNLVASTLTYLTSTHNGSYISATVSDDVERLSFTMYSQADDTLFSPITDDISLGFVFGARGLLTGSYTFRFQISDSSVTENRVQCMLWNRTGAEWIDGDCTVTDVSGTYATFTTSNDGEYALRSLPTEATTANSTVDETTPIPVDVGLSPGAIAGIVVGSVVGVALIGGGVYYFAFHKKSKKKTAVSPTPQDDNVEMQNREEGGNDNASYDGD